MSQEFFDKIKALGINCYKCLDTRLVWKQRNNNEDGLGYFIMLTCDHCYNYSFVQYSKKSNIYINGVPIFNVDNNNVYDMYMQMERLPTLRKLYDMYVNRKSSNIL